MTVSGKNENENARRYVLAQRSMRGFRVSRGFLSAARGGSARSSPLGFLAQSLDHLLDAALHLLVLRGCGERAGPTREDGSFGQSASTPGRRQARAGSRRPLGFRVSESLQKDTHVYKIHTWPRGNPRGAPFFTTLSIFLWKPTSARGFAMAHTGRSSPPSSSSSPPFDLDGVLSFLSFFGVLPSFPMAAFFS